MFYFSNAGYSFYLLPSLCPFLGGSIGGKETAVLNDPLLCGTAAAAAAAAAAVLRDIAGLPADVDPPDAGSSKFLAN
jgi:hypothetical protein